MHAIQARRSIGALLVTGVLATACAGGADIPADVAQPAQVLPPLAAPAPPQDEPAVESPPTPSTNEHVPTPSVVVEPFTATADDPRSTFALDVDTGSYSLARAALRNGTLPDPSQIRIEEFVNAIDQNYPAPTPSDVFVDAFKIVTDGASWPYSPGGQGHLVRIGMASAEVTGERLPASLTFVVDTSGSMADVGRLDLVRDALRLLVDNLRPDDSVALVTYSDDARMLLPPTPAAQAETIRGAIGELQPDGSTNLAAGLDMGYALARQTLRADSINRVILASDGIANTGLTDGGAILETIRDDAAAGIEMVTVGVGLGDFNDALMERLADDGDGFYAYVDSMDEAQHLFGTSSRRHCRPSQRRHAFRWSSIPPWSNAIVCSVSRTVRCRTSSSATTPATRARSAPAIR